MPLMTLSYDMTSIIPLVLGFSNRPVALIGYDMGANVAVGFAAKFPDSCASLTLLSPLGIKYRPLDMGREKLFKRKFIGEYMMMRTRRHLASDQKNEFFHNEPNGPNWNLIQKQVNHLPRDLLSPL